MAWRILKVLGLVAFLLVWTLFWTLVILALIARILGMW